MSLKIGFLGMSDNRSTTTMLDVLLNSDIEIDCVVLLKPTFKANWKRLKRKILAEGFLKSLERIFFSLQTRFVVSREPSRDVPRNYFNYVTSFSSPACLKTIRDNNLDLILLCTDEMIKKVTFSLPKIGTLNAHPGWIPQYRGLGAIHEMIEDGFIPAISVHYINEGVDTGPVVLRENCSLNVVGQSADAEIELNKAQANMFVRAVKLIKENGSHVTDTFLEPSSMTRGYPKDKFQSLYSDIDQLKISLKSIDAQVKNK